MSKFLWRMIVGGAVLKRGACHDLVQSDRFHEESSVGSFPFCVVL